MAKLTTEEARALAEHFYRISKELGNYRFARWNELTRDERREIESLEWSLLNASADFAASAPNPAPARHSAAPIDRIVLIIIVSPPQVGPRFRTRRLLGARR